MDILKSREKKDERLSILHVNENLSVKSEIDRRELDLLKETRDRKLKLVNSRRDSKGARIAKLRQQLERISAA